MIPDPKLIAEIMRKTAEKIVLSRFQSLGADEITANGTGDVVTVADLEAEDTLAKELQIILPGSEIIGEEGVSRDPSIVGALLGSNPVWIIDPIDGTQNFADGKTCFAMIVALIAKGETIAGWIHEPIQNRTVWAIRGEGAYEDEKQLRINGSKSIPRLRGSMNLQYHRWLDERRNIMGKEKFLVREIVRYRCVGAEYADLARGRLDFARYGGRLKPWDHAAGVLIFNEAGGYGAIISTSASYHVGPTISDQVLLLAPNRGSWQKLVELMIT